MLDVTEVCANVVVRGSVFLPAPDADGTHVVNVEILQGGKRIAFLAQAQNASPTHWPDFSPFGQLGSDRRGDSRKSFPRVVGICPRIFTKGSEVPRS